MWIDEEKWNGLREQLDRIERQLRRLSEQQQLQGEVVMADFKDIVAKVAAQKTVIDSTAVLIAGFRAQLAAVVAAPTSADIQGVLDGLDANTNELIAAAPANTPTPTPTPVDVSVAASAATATVAAPASS